MKNKNYRNYRNYRNYKNILILILSISILMNPIGISFAGSDTIYIRSAEDFVDFSRKASLDTYYSGKTIILEEDIDLSRSASFIVPTFSGIFDGQGHTISGVSIRGNGSVKGLFRYLQEDGIIKNLNIQGNINPSGSRNQIGGLVGNNRGEIRNCSFNGNVEADSNVGGLVGVNEVSGIIKNSTAEGSVTGDHFVGGIAGQNLGSILKSTNYARINTSISEATRNIEDINWDKINSTENLRAHTDAGGITGYSSGFLQDCINRGPVGYKEMGYNIGGIVGRQSGYLGNCENYNTVLGRKDVGGIAGQIEPYLMLVFSEDKLQELDRELDLLGSLLNKSFDKAKSSSKGVSGELENITDVFNKSLKNVETLSKGTVDYVDDIAETVNITGERIQYSLEEILPILEEMEESSHSFTKGLDYIELGFTNLETSSDRMEDALEDAREAIDELRISNSHSYNAIHTIKGSLIDLSRKIENKENIKDIEEEIEQSLNKIKSSLKVLEDIFQAENIRELIEVLEIILKEDSSDKDRNKAIEEIIDELKSIVGIKKDIRTTLASLKEEIGLIIRQGVSGSKTNISRNFYDLFYSLEKFFQNLDRTFKNINKSIEGLKSTSKESGKAFKDFSLGFENFQGGSELVSASIASIGDLLDTLSSEPNIELPNITSEYRQSGDDFFKNIRSISSHVDQLGVEISNSKKQAVEDIEAISNQILNIFDILVSSREDISRGEYVEDNSEEDQEVLKSGRVYKNQNFGSVKGATNVGGIVGSMAIEYDLDPEDDIRKKGSSSLNFKYISTAILKNAKNHGRVVAKKDYSGGIVGRMDLGLISEAENYGDVASREGDYVGGIAGASYAKIDKSFVLSSLRGRDYIGGIAGYGNNISNSYSLVQIEKGREYIGAIAGDTEGEVLNNHYVHEKVAAIDGISYEGKACPLSYDELLKLEELPDEFTRFHLNFIADGDIVKRIAFDYKDSFDLQLLPEIPFKEGHEGKWEDFNNEEMTFNKTIEAVYTPYLTVLSSNIVDKDRDLPILLAEGQFSGDVNLRISPYEIGSNKAYQDDEKILESWEIELRGIEDEEEKVRLRLLMPETKRKVEVWQLGDDGWKPIDSSINGSYIVFDMEGARGVFSIVEDPFLTLSLIVLIIGLALVLIVLFIRRFYIKKKTIKVNH